MATRQQRWGRAVRRAKAGLPFSDTASGTACISVPRRAATASASRSRRPAFELRMAGKVVPHEPPAGSLIIHPAVRLHRRCRRRRRYADRCDRSRVARARRCRGLGAPGGVDRACVELRPLASCACRTLAFESTDDYPNGPLFRNEVASRFIDRLAARHMRGTKVPARARGLLAGAACRSNPTITCFVISVSRAWNIAFCRCLARPPP